MIFICNRFQTNMASHNTTTSINGTLGSMSSLNETDKCQTNSNSTTLPDECIDGITEKVINFFFLLNTKPKVQLKSAVIELF